MASKWIVRDRNGNAWGPFEKTNEPGEWARRKWPDQEQDERREGKGWDIEALRDPNEG